MSEKIKLAIRYARQGDKVAARLELITLLKVEPTNADAWALLAYLTSDRTRRKLLMEKLVALEPNHPYVRIELDKLKSSQATGSTMPPIPSSKDYQSVSEERIVQINKHDTVAPTFHVDELVERWLKVLSYTEYYVVKLLYGLEGDSYSAEAVRRIIGSTIKLRNVNEVRDFALTKLRSPESKSIVSPLSNLLFSIVQEASSSDVETVATEMQRTVLVSKFDLAGIIRLLLDVGDGFDLVPGMTSSRTRPPTSEAKSTNQSIYPYARIDEEPSVYQKPIDVLGLPTRIYNALRRANVSTIGEVMRLYPDKYTSIPNLGTQSVEALLSILHSRLTPEQLPSLQVTADDVPHHTQGQTLGEHGKSEPVTLSLLGLPLHIKNALEKTGITSISQLASIMPSEPGTAPVGEVLRDAIEPYLRRYFSNVKESVLQLDISRRAVNSLLRSNVSTIGQLVLLSADELLQVRNLGSQSVQEIQSALWKYLAAYAKTWLPADEAPESAVQWNVADYLPDGFPESVLSQISVYRLGLVRDDERRLEGAKIWTLADLIQSSEMLARLPYVKTAFGRYMSWLATATPEEIDREVGGAGLSPLHQSILSTTSVRELVDSWMFELSSRAKRVIRQRFGLDGEVKTLTKIGKEIGVTRERIRQIQLKALQRLRGKEFLQRIQPLVAFLEAELALRNGALHIDDLTSAGLCGIKLDFGRSNIVGIISLICEIHDELEFSRRQRLITAGSSFESVLAVQNSFVEILEESMRPLELNALLDSIKTRGLYEYKSDRLDDFLLACLRASPQIQEREPNLFELTRWKNRIVDEIVMSLVELGRPSHYSLITDKVNELLPDGQKTDRRNVHAHLGRYNDIFVRVGHGIFGLAGWGLHDDGNIANAVYRVLKEAGHPLHIDVITERVLQTWHVQPASVNMAIQNDDRFVRTGQSVYSLHELMGSETELREPDFADLYGDKLAKWEEGIVEETPGEKVDTHIEVDKLRNIGLDFFQ